MPADLTSTPYESCIPLHTLAVHLNIVRSAEFPPHSKHNVPNTNTTGIRLRVLCTVRCQSAHCAHRYVPLCTPICVTLHTGMCHSAHRYVSLHTGMCHCAHRYVSLCTPIYVTLHTDMCHSAHRYMSLCTPHLFAPPFFKHF
jgi:hypothetical protein